MFDVQTRLGQHATIEVGIDLEPKMPVRDPMTCEVIANVPREEVFYIQLKNTMTCSVWKMRMTREQAEEIGAGLMQMLSLGVNHG